MPARNSARIRLLEPLGGGSARWGRRALIAAVMGHMDLAQPPGQHLVVRALSPPPGAGTGRPRRAPARPCSVPAHPPGGCRRPRTLLPILYEGASAAAAVPRAGTAWALPTSPAAITPRCTEAALQSSVATRLPRQALVSHPACQVWETPCSQTLGGVQDTLGLGAWPGPSHLPELEPLARASADAAGAQVWRPPSARVSIQGPFHHPGEQPYAAVPYRSPGPGSRTRGRASPAR